MTRAARHPLVVEVGAPRPRGAELVWDLSSRAGRSLAHEHGLNGDPVVGVALVIRRRGRAGKAVAQAEALMRSGARAPLGEERPCRTAWRREHQLEHIDAEGVVHCTLRHGEPTRTLFAHSPLLADLGVRPGAYSLRSVRLIGPG